MSENQSVLSGYLTSEQLAVQLGCAVRTLQHWRANRKGPPVTIIGNKPYYSESSVRRWLASQEKEMVCGRKRGRTS